MIISPSGTRLTATPSSSVIALPIEFWLMVTMSRPLVVAVGLTTLVQYWRSFDHLEAYARAPDKHHWPAWVEFNRRMKNSRGDVGIWHETYRVRAGEYESIYSGMPLMGLAKAGRQAAVGEGSESARERLGGRE